MLNVKDPYEVRYQYLLVSKYLKKNVKKKLVFRIY